MVAGDRGLSPESGWPEAPVEVVVVVEMKGEMEVRALVLGEEK